MNTDLNFLLKQKGIIQVIVIKIAERIQLLGGLSYAMAERLVRSIKGKCQPVRNIDFCKKLKHTI